MNEAETRAELIDPALRTAGWGIVDRSRIRREVIAPGRLLGNGRRAPAQFADYVLEYRGHKLAVLEAKKRSEPDTLGVAQAKDYAAKLETRFAYSSNGDGIYQIDMRTGKEGHISHYPSPQDLWTATFSEDNEWRDRFAEIPFEDRSGTWEARYYQHNAIQHVLEALCAGRDRILLTMATGTGKTFVAFQLTWKLFQSRWNLSQKPTHRPRILFLADRNILADQAFNAFASFPEDALVRIDPKAIQKRGRVPKNGSVFFTIFQTFMTGKDAQGNPAPKFGDYPPDFFDFIIIDECHRGGAKDESSWRGILDYFAPAVQLGLTATPKRENNADTYAYFGDPVYTYALKSGINDGFLTPFKVCQFETSLDEYLYSPDDDLIEGDIDPDKVYTESDFNRIIEIEERERFRVQQFMAQIDQNQKTLVFCANQDHALAIRNLVNQIKISPDPNYCVRVTADEGERGEQFLRAFQDNEKTTPTILTTSKKLSTGVDARNVRNIVLLRVVGSMIEFKQIVGRGTRTFEGKDYFTIYDFVKAYEHFNDREWDGEPAAPVPMRPSRTSEAPGGYGTSVHGIEQGSSSNPDPKPRKIIIQLADGKERTLHSSMQTSFWSADGKPISAAKFVERLFGEIPDLFKDEEELRQLWSQPDTRNALLDGLAERGYGDDQLKEITRLIQAENSDLYDVLAYIAYAKHPLTRQERVIAQKTLIFAKYDGKQRDFLDFVLQQYVQTGVGELDPAKLPKLLELKYHALHDALQTLGNSATIRSLFVEFQQYLYQTDRVA
ncbi:EcoAI/FtnUII family type I restriction enzme subunit R [Lyngbya confervoides]|uniref:DEAD/DEAH box helicase family protein n=1 Tax=Lyngbya confervoides BDU141951 TaxID=1574623 RepID=A0ABD4T4B9_9CYAN|nr:type I restriction endonuclease subunit R [Lyngbya confervoides]MCM1983276.1 DEAD/DEAH box helicase family protein [Lyngbya confervoides BDU141951]